MKDTRQPTLHQRHTSEELILLDNLLRILNNTSDTKKPTWIIIKNSRNTANIVSESFLMRIEVSIEKGGS